MHFETDGDEFIEAQVRGNIQSRGENHGPEEKKMALDINFKADFKAAYILPRIWINQDDLDPNTYLHDTNGDVRRLGWGDLKIDREFEEYFMTISFSPLHPDKDAQRFAVERIKVTKLILKDGGIITTEFAVQLHPYHREDVGYLCIDGIEKGSQCTLLKFERAQTDLADEADKAA